MANIFLSQIHIPGFIFLILYSRLYILCCIDLAIYACSISWQISKLLERYSFGRTYNCCYLRNSSKQHNQKCDLLNVLLRTPYKPEWRWMFCSDILATIVILKSVFRKPCESCYLRVDIAKQPHKTLYFGDICIRRPYKYLPFVSFKECKQCCF